MPTSSSNVRLRSRGPGRSAAVLALGATLALTIAGCSSSSTGQSGAPVVINGTTTSAGGIRGDELSQPVVLDAAAKNAVFQSTAGGTTTLGALQKGGLMLLYFGYTHCPDVCPTTMADIGLALKKVPAQTQARTQVVFVTSDPARDTTSVEKQWLANFDSGLTRPFVGLTASLSEIDAVAKSVGVPLSPPVKEPDGSITVEHGAQTLAFTADKAHVVWLAGTSQGDYAHDIAALDPGPS
ncbi:SCO family protein [uncultured Jatrophihabitans sp.]|uniref:SCO family protein n=1 Tax=uncultured Jatrophihabitans sp. TaxID=1610747 RepID=UPI0035CBAC8E